MKMTKLAHEKLAAELAPIEAADRQAAFEIGFAKEAQELGMDEGTYNDFREIVIARTSGK